MNVIMMSKKGITYDIQSSSSGAIITIAISMWMCARSQNIVPDDSIGKKQMLCVGNITFVREYNMLTTMNWVDVLDWWNASSSVGNNRPYNMRNSHYKSWPPVSIHVKLIVIKNIHRACNNARIYKSIQLQMDECYMWPNSYRFSCTNSLIRLTVFVTFNCYSYRVWFTYWYQVFQSLDEKWKH